MDLIVSLNGFHVGTLTKDKHGGLHFTYQQPWLALPGCRPISLSLPLSSSPYSGEKVYNFFDNLLPDNQRIRDKVQTRFNASSNHAFDLLSAIGNDCVGAIQLTDKLPDNVKQIRAKPLSEQAISTLLSSYKEAPLGMDDTDDDFRISIAGAQEKTALLKLDGSWHKPMGTTPTTHIFKLPIGELPSVNIDLTDSCENEFICLELARVLGFDVARSQVLTFDTQKVFCVERFDRRFASDKRWIMRLPQEDFCQALGLGSAKKYQADGGPTIKDCMDLLRSSVNQKDRETFFKTQILFWLLAAIDGHGKNFSVFLLPENRFQMTPLYDVISAYPVMSKKGLQKQKIKMAMSLKGKNTHWKWAGILPRHFISTAKHVGYSEAKAKQHIEELIGNIEEAISSVQQKIPVSFPEYVAQSIFAGIRERVTLFKSMQ